MNPINYHFKIDLIREKLNNKGRSQAELARFLGVTNQTIVNIFKSDTIRIDMLQKIAEFLDVSFAEFFVNKKQETLQFSVDNLLINNQRQKAELINLQDDHKAIMKENVKLQEIIDLQKILLKDHGIIKDKE